MNTQICHNYASAKSPLHRKCHHDANKMERLTAGQLGTQCLAELKGNIKGCAFLHNSMPAQVILT